MEKFCVEVDVKIRYLDEKVDTFLFLTLFYTLSKTKKMKPYLENSLHIDFKNGLKIELSCRNDGVIKCGNRCKISDKEGMGREAAGKGQAQILIKTRGYERLVPFLFKIFKMLVVTKSSHILLKINKYLNHLKKVNVFLKGIFRLLKM